MMPITIRELEELFNRHVSAFKPTVRGSILEGNLLMDPGARHGWKSGAYQIEALRFNVKMHAGGARFAASIIIPVKIAYSYNTSDMEMHVFDELTIPGFATAGREAEPAVSRIEIPDMICDTVVEYTMACCVRWLTVAIESGIESAMAVPPWERA
jgi:hypothetical protein